MKKDRSNGRCSDHFLVLRPRGQNSERHTMNRREGTQRALARINPDDIDKMSTALIDVGVSAVKRNPIKTAFYFLGLMLCLFFNGLELEPSQIQAYENDMKDVDFSLTDDAFEAMQRANHMYRSSAGWFSCDARCERLKADYHAKQSEYKMLLSQEREQMRDAKSKIGIFSTYGVAETRSVFDQYWTRGKRMAANQSRWDALFIGISSMGRDEGLIDYVLRVAMNVLFNFTIGLIGTVVTFIWSLYEIINAYKTPLLHGFLFFLLASLGAISFALSYAVAIYMAAAGTVYVGAKVIASNMRVENGSNYGGPQRRLHSD